MLAAHLPLADAAEPAAVPVIGLIIDDIGDRHHEGRRTVELPGPVACAFLPFTPYSTSLADAAHESGKEVMLHLPMQATAGNALGPGAVEMDMSQSDFLQAVRANLAVVPHVVGVNNHMGSLLTRHPGHMTWLMQELHGRGDLFFVDSRTSDKTVAERMAQEQGVPSLRRDVFLDHHRSVAAVEASFDRLLATAKRQGYAVGIGHPYPETLEVLERRLPRLAEDGVRLVPIRQIIQMNNREKLPWRVSSSP